MGCNKEGNIPSSVKTGVLLVDDEEPIRKLLAAFLKRYGYTVIEAEDGQQAVDEFAHNCEKCGLVIMDVLLPKKNGVDAANEIWQIRPDVQVIFMSGYTGDISLTLPANSVFVSKPFDVVSFIEKIVKDERF